MLLAMPYAFRKAPAFARARAWLKQNLGAARRQEKKALLNAGIALTTQLSTVQLSVPGRWRIT